MMSHSDKSMSSVFCVGCQIFNSFALSLTFFLAASFYTGRPLLFLWIYYLI